MGHSAEGQQRVRSGDGRHAGRLYAATRSRLPAGLPGRDLKAAHCRNARADPDETGAPGPSRLRVRAQRDRQSLHDVCSVFGTDRRSSLISSSMFALSVACWWPSNCCSWIEYGQRQSVLETGHFRDTRCRRISQVIEMTGAPYGNRTRVSAVKGRRPRPLDEGRGRRGDI